ncbi:surface rod structure-forming protein G [Kribbella voronezhensis]|uniref:Surface rod structure-forming protein G n=1 Tax=Kribbella voronezhensis TaxID=2512212 RepID=A0A4R7TDE4_9ACTN|nr:G5 domain-containing protein [Kribbella voronezhensis]TDU90161.1 surface rod structure-forming protein G [Kribbella voronezhensis]
MRSGRLLCTAVLLLSAGLLTGCGAEEKAAGQVPVAAPVTTVETTPSVEVTPSEVAPTPVEASTPVQPTAPPVSAAPVTVKRTVVETKTIPFKKRTALDSSVPKGQKSITKRGVNGVRRLTYEVTLVDGVQTAKRLVKQVVATQPVTQITTVGTKVDEPSGGGGCDPNYSGCVPIASDVDCAGGSGNGPEYVQGPVTVIGSDIYGLDADHDGIGCE